MQPLTPAGQRLVDQLAQRFGLRQDTVTEMLVAVNNGGGTMAQFNCPELGGGQWMRGGMTMVGDMFNHGLKATVDNLCNELAGALAREQVFAPVAMAPAMGGGASHGWWPGDLGRPFSTGSQNNVRYAVFPRRLAVEAHGRVTVYDTLDHQIGGVSQQQGGDSALTFTSQHGTVSVASLPVLHGEGTAQPQVNFAQAPVAPQSQPYQRAAAPDWPAPPPVQAVTAPAPAPVQRSQSGTEAIALIEQLARLRDAGVLTDDEFNSKKRELLDRL
ncbi:MAG: SHOCT domain-containing protein [Comamonadaceae bacterium]|nr:MAG: SHOCT domain-containing protein [Comamonadaceae bacterium]